MVNLSKVVVFLLLVSSCRGGVNDSKESSVIQVRDEPQATESKEVESEKLLLTRTPILSTDRLCRSGGDVSCTDNVLGFACATSSGELGLCAGGSGYCECVVFSKVAEPNPKIANYECSSGSESPCGSLLYGDPCVLTGKREAGYCAPSDNRNQYCKCARYVDNRGSTAIAAPPPANLQVDSLLANSFNITWSTGGGSTSSFLIIGVAGPVSALPVECTGGKPATSPFRQTGAKQLTTYSYRVCAVNADGVSGGSATISATTPEAGISTPLNLSATTGAELPAGLFNTTIKWDADVNDVATGYKIAIGRDRVTCAEATDIGKVTSYAINGQIANVATTVTLCAFDKDAKLAAPAYLSFLTPSINSQPLCGSVYEAALFREGAYDIRGNSVNMPRLGNFDKVISALKVSKDCKIQLFSDVDFGGTAFESTVEINDMFVKTNFNDLARSLKCLCGNPPFFSDDFNRPNSSDLSPNWAETSGDFSIKDGTLAAAGSDADSLAVGTTSHNNIDIEADYSLPTTPSGIVTMSLVGRYSGPGNSGMYIGQVQSVNGSLAAVIYKNLVAGGPWITIGANSNNIPKSGKLRFMLQGTTLTLYLNGAVVVTGTDSSLTTGKFGVRGRGTSSTVDNFTVKAL